MKLVEHEPTHAADRARCVVGGPGLLGEGQGGVVEDE
jgi:hypothetical protein